jgi:hypothetical protein
MVVTVSATCLIADFEPIGQSFTDPHHLIDRPYPSAVHELTCLVKHTNRDMSAVDIESDVVHDGLRELGTVGTVT